MNDYTFVWHWWNDIGRGKPNRFNGLCFISYVMWRFFRVTEVSCGVHIHGVTVINLSRTCPSANSLLSGGFY